MENKNILHDNIGSIKLISQMGNEKTIVQAARVSYNQTSKGKEKDDKLIQYLIRNKHTSPLEHVQFTFFIKCPIFVAREWMRHRTWSYNEISRRYTSEDIQFYIPKVWRLQDTKNKQGSYSKWKNSDLLDNFKDSMDNSLQVYHTLLKNNVARELARSVLPVGMYTSFYATVDLNNLMKFILLRVADNAQLEIRLYAEELLIYIKENFPIVYEEFVQAFLGKKEYNWINKKLKGN